MTLDEIRESDRIWLWPADVAAVIGCDPQSIRNQAREDPSRLGFPVTVIGTRTMIPRKLFLAYIEGETK